MAKKFPNQAETLEPLPYFTTAEEKYLAFHKETLIGGNIRIWLKEKETERLQDAWRELKVHADFPSKFSPNQSIKRAEGKHSVQPPLLPACLPTCLPSECLSAYLPA